jgi:hypothetical protein
VVALVAGLFIVVAAVAVVSCVASSGPFACSDSADRLEPSVEKELERLMDSRGSVVAVGQCYEGGHDGFSLQYAATAADEAIAVFPEAFACERSQPQTDELAPDAEMTCEVAGATVNVAVDFYESYDRLLPAHAEAYVYLEGKADSPARGRF